MEEERERERERERETMKGLRGGDDTSCLSNLGLIGRGWPRTLRKMLREVAVGFVPYV